MQSLNKIDPTSTKINKKNPVVIALIPAYNESQNIGKIIAETSKHVSSIIVVDDGSYDNTAIVAASMNAKVIRNGRNMGKGIALKRGLIECLKYTPDIIVTLDADGQHDPTEIPKLVSPIENEEADIVIGSRYEKNGKSNSLVEVPLIRRIGLSFIDLLNRSLMKTTIRDSQSGFRAYTLGVLNLISNYSSKDYGVETEQLAAAELYGFRIVEVPITIRYQGLVNTSKKNSVLHGANIVSTILRIAIERRPLLFFGLTGTFLLVAAVITISEMLLIFNQTRYFSLPLALITLGLLFLGSMLILVSFVFYGLKRIRER